MNPKGGEKIYYPTVKMEKGYGSVAAPLEEIDRTNTDYFNNNKKDSYGFSKFYFGLTDYTMNSKTYNDEYIGRGFLFGLGVEVGVNNFEFSLLFNWRYINDFDFTLNSVSFNIDYLFNNRSIITPYIGTGINYNSYETDFSYSGYSHNEDNITKNKNISFSFRAGLKFDISKNTLLDISIEKRLKNE